MFKNDITGKTIEINGVPIPPGMIRILSESDGDPSAKSDIAKWATVAAVKYSKHMMEKEND